MKNLHCGYPETLLRCWSPVTIYGFAFHVVVYPWMCGTLFQLPTWWTIYLLSDTFVCSIRVLLFVECCCGVVEHQSLQGQLCPSQESLLLTIILRVLEQFSTSVWYTYPTCSWTVLDFSWIYRSATCTWTVVALSSIDEFAMCTRGTVIALSSTYEFWRVISCQYHLCRWQCDYLCHFDQVAPWLVVIVRDN